MAATDVYPIGPVPRVSVGLPVYNGERFLAQAIDSVLQQTHSDLELVISDNASTDRTEEICRSYTTQDSRVRYFRSSANIGACRNFSRVFELSRAPYFKWACYDDICVPGFLEKCVAVWTSPRMFWCATRGVLSLMRTAGSLANTTRAATCDRHVPPIALPNILWMLLLPAIQCLD